MRALFKSENLIGDALYIGPALRAWMHSRISIMLDEVFIQTLPDHVSPLYQGMVRDLFNVETVFQRPEGTFDFEHTFDVSKAFELSHKKKIHIAESYAELLGVELDRYVDSVPGIASKKALKPIYIPDESAQGKWMEGPHQTLGTLKGCILISMFSASCTSRDPKCNFIPNKQLPYDKWKPILQAIRKEYPETLIRFLGAPEHIEDVNKNLLYAKGIIQPGECMFGIPLNRLALIMQKAKLLVTIDNGMSHLGASQETPTFLMYPRCLGPHYILPIGNPNLVWVHMDPVYVNPAQLVQGLGYAIKKFKVKETENADTK